MVSMMLQYRQNITVQYIGTILPIQAERKNSLIESDTGWEKLG